MSNKSEDKWTQMADEARKAEELVTEENELASEDNQTDSIADVAQPANASEQKALEYPDYAELEQQLGQAETKINDYWNKILRLQAEMDNLQRRAERDVANAHKFGIEKLILELLPVLDSIHKGLEIDTADNELAKRLHEGMELALSMCLKALTKFGVSMVDPKGETFNPAFHEAISMVEQADTPSNTVVQVLQKGFVLNGRLVRPALVIVAK